MNLKHVSGCELHSNSLG